MVEIVVLRLVHLLTGTFWVGTAIFTAAFLLPAMSQAGPAAAGVMSGLQRRKLMVWLPLAALLALISGLRLLWLVSGGFSPAYFATSRGLTFAVSGSLAVVAFLLGLLISRPAMSRAAMLGQRAASAEADERDRLASEIQALRRRAAATGLWVAVLLILATAGMAVARYV